MTLDPKITMQNSQENQVVKRPPYVTTLEKSLYGTGQNGAIKNQWKMKRLENQ